MLRDMLEAHDGAGVRQTAKDAMALEVQKEFARLMAAGKLTANQAAGLALQNVRLRMQSRAA